MIGCVVMKPLPDLFSRLRHVCLLSTETKLNRQQPSAAFMPHGCDQNLIESNHFGKYQTTECEYL